MLLIGNGKLVTRDESRPFIADGCVAVGGTAIRMVGTTSEVRAKYPMAEFIDAKGGIIMPGFINSHMHFYSTFSRGFTPPGDPSQNFGEVLERLWWKLDKALTLKDTYYSTMTALVDAIKCGCTTIIDHHASPNSVTDSLSVIAEATAEAGIRASLCYEVSDRDGERIAYEGIRENIRFIDWAKKENNPMISGKFGLHASFTIGDITLAKCREAMGDRDAGYHVHVAEGPADEKECEAKHGKRIAERFREYGITGPNSIFVHCIHINDEERRILAESSTAVVHNPESNMGNAVGCGPVIRLFQEGILLGLGTDGYTNDMIESYKVGNIIHKHNLCDPTVAWGEIPTMLFENNPKIAGRFFKRPLGVLKPGAYADVIVTDYDPLTPMDGNNVNGHILFGMNGRSVVSTVCNGKVLMKDRKVLVADEKLVMQECRASATKLWKSING